MNPIANHIAEFLKKYKPFNSLTHNQLIDISLSIKVLNIEKNKSLFQINDKLHEFFYVVNAGTISLTVISDAEESLLNKCYSGDVFGLRPFFAKNNYMMSATARDESIIYAIPIVSFKPLLAVNSEVLDFLLESFASTSTVSKDNNSNNSISNQNQFLDNQSEIQYFQSLEYSRKPIFTGAKTSIKEVAIMMNEHNIDNMIIADNNLPIGIVTDSHFRSKVAIGLYSSNDSIDKIMASPVITVPENLSLAEAQLLMLKHSVSHLCVTIDGSDKSELKGIITEHDLVVAQTNNPGVLIKEIKRAQSNKELKIVREKLSGLTQTSIYKNIPISHISAISGEITFSIIKRAIELTILEIGTPPAKFSWLSIGSQGRKEQILLTDQDSMLIFDDVEAESYRDVKDYFLKLAKKTISALEKIGYPTCINGHMANNLVFCKSLSEWNKHFNSWISEPTENNNDLSNIFLDFDFVYGNTEFEKSIQNTVIIPRKNNARLYDFLGNITLKKPAPLNFFKKLNLEEDGLNKGKFDIKNKGIMPLIDAARLLIIAENIKGINNTYQRFKQLAINDPENKEVYKNAAEAFNELIKISTIEGLKNDNSGQFITIEELSKSDKEKLKNAFSPFKDLEEIIKGKFTLTHFS
jgi:CBS domain-containing protein